MTENVTVPRTDREVQFLIAGPGREAPAPILTAPGGRTIKVTEENLQKGDGFRAFRRGDGTTLVLVEKAEAGQWKVEAPDGTPAIASAKVVVALEEPKVRAKLSGTGASRTLDYTFTSAPGDQVRIVEDGEAVARQFDTRSAPKARGSAVGPVASTTQRGKVRFDVGEGSPGKRVLYAVIERNGLAIKKTKIAAYTAPKPPKVAKVRGLRLKRLGRNRLELRWSRVAGAASYEVTVRLADGRVLRSQAAGRRTSLRLPGVGSAVGATATVVTVRKSGRESAAAKTKLAPKQPKRAKPIVLR